MDEEKSARILQRIVRVGARIPRGTLEGICRAIEQSTAGDGIEGLSASLAAVSDPSVRNELIGLFSEWSSVPSDPGPRALAWSLRGASATDQSWRDTHDLDLVWTGPAPPSGVLRRTEQALLEVIEGARSELWLVSFAGYKVPRIRDSLRLAAERGATIRFVIESPEASAGKVTFSALQGIGPRLSEVATIYVWPIDRRERNDEGKYGSLHVKCALADDRLLFVSSANLTEFAMSLNMELGLLVRDEEIPRRVGEHLRWLVERRILVPISPD